MTSKVRVYIACSLDGFIAGPEDDLSWLPEGPPDDPEHRDPESVGYEDFMAEVGALLMGRRTYDVVTGFDVPWPYGDRPVLIATRRPLTPIQPTVRAITGDIREMVAAATEAAKGKDVYIDGGNLIRQAMAANLIDELIVTVVPMILGRGIALFAGMAERHALEFVGNARYLGMVQLKMRPKRTPGRS